MTDHDARRRKSKPKKRPERRKRPRTLHVINDHTRPRDFQLARADMVNFFMRKYDDY